MKTKLDSLREELAGLEQRVSSQDAPQTFSFGFSQADDVLGAGLVRGGLHEIFTTRQADAGAATGFAVALALRAAEQTRPIAWVRQTYAGYEIGNLYAPGLRTLGCEPDKILLIELRAALDLLRAGLEATRCAALGAVIIEPWGQPKALDFTATRRLALAAARSGVTVFLLRLGVASHHSAAQIRWQVSAGASEPLAAGAPGLPVFNITLLRQRAGSAGQNWHLEWDHEQHIFRQPSGAAPLSGSVVSLPERGPASPPAPSKRQTIARAQ